MEQNQHPQPPLFNQQPGQQPAPQFQPRVVATPMLEPVNAVTRCFKKFFDFKGRARRSEFWWYVLFTVIVSWAFSFLGAFSMVFTFIGLLVSLVLLIPQISAMTRRLHDTGRSGWWVLGVYGCVLVVYGAFASMLLPHASALMGEGDDMALAMIVVDAIQESPGAMGVAAIAGMCSVILGIITLVFCIQDSNWNENKYGPSPKYQ